MLERTERILFRGVAFASEFKANSECDRCSPNEKIAQDKKFNCKEPILMILGEVAKIRVISLSICKNDQIFYYDEKSRLREDT